MIGTNYLLIAAAICRSPRIYLILSVDTFILEAPATGGKYRLSSMIAGLRALIVTARPFGAQNPGWTHRLLHQRGAVSTWKKSSKTAQKQLTCDETHNFKSRGCSVKKMFVGGLPVESTEESVTELFAEFGRVRSIKLASDVFSGKCKGFGFVEMEGHEARKAIAALDGKVVGEKSLRVQFENPKGKGGKRPRR